MRQSFLTVPGACEHVFVGAAGSPHAAFRRAIEARNLTRAITEARDLPQISLADAAELVVLAADDPKHPLIDGQAAGPLGTRSRKPTSRSAKRKSCSPA